MLHILSTYRKSQSEWKVTNYENLERKYRR